VGRRELAARRNLRQAIKATKRKLHQVGGAYMRHRDYRSWLARLGEAAAEGDKALREACRELMGYHASTRERLPILEGFYFAMLDGLARVRSVVDVGCGLNPLSIPWMALAPDARYLAYDIYGGLVEFLSEALPLLGVRGLADTRDVVHQPPSEAVDLALVLKAIPCLEQIDGEAGSRLLDALRAKYILVSFPAESLGGRDKGMAAHYEAHFWELVEGRGWRVEGFRFPGELAFLAKT
jgi:16S rRNA (guanine(1405)-N(7))-methyltransferase